MGLMPEKMVGESILTYIDDANGIAIDPHEKYVLIHTTSNKLLCLILATEEIVEITTDTKNISNGSASEEALIAATNQYFIWCGNRTLNGWTKENRNDIFFRVPQVTSLCVDQAEDCIVFASEDRRIRIGSLKEKRILSSFDWGERIDWSKSHAIYPFWYSTGLVKSTEYNHILCLSKDRITPLSTNQNYCNIFDGDYHICLEAVEQDADNLVVRNLRTGETVVSIPDDLLCVAYNNRGTDIFSTRSDFRWAKYIPDRNSVIANYWAGQIKVWDGNSKLWKEIGNWNAEVSHILSFCSEDDWDTMREHLIDISFRSCVIGEYVIRGTFDGHIQFWDFDGCLRNEIPAHREKITTIYPIPNSTCFISEDKSHSRVIWNGITMEKIDEDCNESCINEKNILGIISGERKNVFTTNPNRDLLIFTETLENTMLIGCSEKESPNSNRILSQSGDVVIFYDNTEDDNQILNSHIRVYDVNLQELRCKYDLCWLFSKPLLDWEFSNFYVNLSLNADGDLLAVAFADGCVLVFDLHVKNELDSVVYDWEPTSVHDLRNCMFHHVDMEKRYGRILKQNGAIVEE